MADDLAAEILAELRQIRELLAAGAAPRPASRSDDAAALAVLLPAIWRTQGEAVWCVNDLVADQVVDRAAGQRVGRLLARNAGVAVAGFTLFAVGSDYSGRLWCLRRG
jgi:hypothetical protein